ncbi:MAG TPA: hypothetical protein VI997_03930 [Candidatus Thermoplasmatota archaeon]|nr:hypothetical protein [Candidatus Thermoplasmatota archaeon]
MRAHLGLVVLIAAAPVLAGCLTPSAAEVLQPASSGGIRIEDEAGAPVAFAAVTALGPGGPLRALASGADGVVDIALIPPATSRVVVAAPGLATTEIATPLPPTIRLAPLAAALAADDAAPVLRFLPPVDLGGAALAHEATCPAWNCGLSEPVIEVAGDGTVYYSATCCVGLAPPVWASRDGGTTFQQLDDAYRHATGIEGDFAVDDAGNVYFTDILIGAGWFTSWDATGKERWTVPVPFPPLVDRPWVRAGAEDVVYFAYNTGRDTLFYRSIDGGKTWGAAPLFAAGFNLGNLGQGPENEHLYIVGSVGDKVVLRETTDGGDTWSDAIEVPTPDVDGGVRDQTPVVADEAGNLWVVYAWGEKGVYDVYAVRRDTTGEWHEPLQVSAPGVPTGAEDADAEGRLGTNAYPWPAALKDGTLAIAWYAAPWAEVHEEPAGGLMGGTRYGVEDDEPWYIMVAASIDAGSDAPTFQRVLADPEPVLTGDLGRRLLDFVQIDVAPDGALHLAYAAQHDASQPERAMYARTTTGLRFDPAMFPSGPMEGAAHGHAGALGLAVV